MNVSDRHASSFPMARPPLPTPGRTGAQCGFTLVDTLIASTLLLIGVLSSATTAMYCAKLQRSTQEYSQSHLITCGVLEQLRTGDLAETFEKFSAHPDSTVDGQEVVVEFPETALTRVFGDCELASTELETVSRGGTVPTEFSSTSTSSTSTSTTDLSSMAAEGLLPVRVIVRRGTRRFEFTTFVGEK